MSISQLCDGGSKVIFDDSSCNVLDGKTDACILSEFCVNNVYIIDMLNLDCNATCLNAFNEDSSYGIED